MKPNFLAILCLLALGLSGCGNKGPLVLPNAPAADVPPLDAPADGDPEPEMLNEVDQQPVQGDASEGGEAATPPVEPPR
jgi:predicted small lipoprotein YifL